MVFNKEIARFAFGVIGNIISLILFLSPLPTFVRIRKKKSVERFSAVPYLATFINCGLWVLYGIPLVHPHSILVVTTNGTGFAIEGVYLTLFLLYSDRKKRTKIFLIIVGEIIFLASLAILVLTLVQTHAKRSAIVGSICIAGNILMYASPLAIMKLVITTKSVEFMPFFLSLFSFLNGVSWTTYALIPLDAFVLAPNSMGIALGLAQLLLYAMYYKSTKRQNAGRKAEEELDLTEQTGSSVTRKTSNSAGV
ncbi:bidirectional sugar transporter SWEET4-like isoform X1 [Nicotiana tabacum]|uniref:Bidirectional sugar transporter SWEET n=1 Tax=Nicotiana tabacum TaxID=4097 RepID=A0A1S3ZM27_TOBAC|nr:bidirectional sugar transporter SWEET4-like [Nicotiana tomentosiformis]XP_016465417.1 PREDICTED: bidirectional sugar transporter SWEET4-like isoform X1 [Nicotiana tabacum]